MSAHRRCGPEVAQAVHDRETQTKTAAVLAGVIVDLMEFPKDLFQLFR